MSGRKEKKAEEATAESLPGTEGHGAPHVNYAVEGCGCLQCVSHRLAKAYEAMDEADARRPPPPGWRGAVKVGSNATAGLKRALELEVE